MRRLTLLAVLVVALAACGGSSQAGKSVRVEFGISGGNIRPQKFVLTVSGDLANELRKAGTSGGTISCAGTLPDVAAEYIRVGGRTVAVRGSCRPTFTRLWKKLYALRGTG